MEEQDENGRSNDPGSDAGDPDGDRNQEAKYDFHGITYLLAM
jgi:hypothetical protein